MSLPYKLHDIVVLDDYREGVIVEIYKDGEAYEIEFKLGKEYETETIKSKNILGNIKDFISCPLVDRKIEIGDCIENRDVADGLIIDTNMPQHFIQKENWKDICKGCKYHNC